VNPEPLIAEPPGAHPPSAFARFFRTEAAGAIVLLAVAALALVLANSAAWGWYESVRNAPVTIGVGRWLYVTDFAHLVDELLMALFFLVIGLEIKREMIVGELSDRRRATLPILAAIGGMLVPALIYLAINRADPVAAAGWGIPVATDIAFALGILALVGRGAPPSMRVFLAALAIADDVGAILVIALFYSSGVSAVWLAAAAVTVLALVGLNLLGIDRIWPYLVVGTFLWFAVLQSGLHATLAGVILAFTIPAKARVSPGDFVRWARGLIDRIEEIDDPDAHVLADDAQQRQALALSGTASQVAAPLQRLEHALHPFTTYVVLPLFAFVNAGVHLPSTGASVLASPVALGVALGLVLGKPIGIVTASVLAVRAGLADLPAQMSWRHVLGVGVLGGIGFTMSLFVANLAFPDAPLFLAEAKLAILLTSVVAGTLGYLVLRRTTGVRPAEEAR